MAKLDIALKYDDLSVNSSLDSQTATLQIQSVVLSASTSPKDLISNDDGNTLKLGGDGKLYTNTYLTQADW